MYCARCGAEVGVSEITCSRCALDLRLSGAVRMTDPALDALLPGRSRPASGSPRAGVGPSRFSAARPAATADAATQVLPTVPPPSGGPAQSQDATQTQVLQLGSSADDQLTEVIATGGSGDEEQPRLLNPPSNDDEQSVDRTRVTSRVVPRPDQDQSALPAQWFRDPQAEYEGALGRPEAAPAPVFTPPAVPRPAPEPQPVQKVRRTGRRLGPLLVIMLVAVMAVLAAMVWWLFGNLTSKADGQAAITVPVAVAAAAAALEQTLG